jgi:CRISPR system Cascade subunit CasE
MNTTYLARLTLDPMQRHVQRDLADCYAMHRRMLSLFPDGLAAGNAREQLGVLYRIEQARQGPIALVQSRVAPDGSRLPSNYLAQPPEVKRVDPFYEALQRNTSLLFRLRANPTRRISARNTSQSVQWRGKRIDLRSEQDQLDWLAHRGEQFGFALLAVRTQPTHSDAHDVRTTTGATVHGNKPAAGKLAFGSVLFEGRLRVTDPDAFRGTLEAGIGSGKAFGFGLLSIAPAATHPDL